MASRHFFRMHRYVHMRWNSFHIKMKQYKDIIQKFIMIQDRGRPCSKSLCFAPLRPQHLLLMRRLPWPTFHCAVTFDVEDLIEKKKSQSIDF